MCETEKELAPPGFEHNCCSRASQRITILLWNSNPGSKGSKIRWKMSVDHSTSVRRCRGIDQLEANGFVWNFKTGQLCIGGQGQPAVLHINNYLYILNV